MGLFDILFGSNKSSSEMTDRELQRELDRGVHRNTGKSIAERASMIREGERRGIYANQDKDK
jgi:hypothetical protein